MDRRLWVFEWPGRYGMFQLRCFRGPTVVEACIGVSGIQDICERL